MHLNYSHSSYIWLKAYKNATSVAHLNTCLMDVCTLWPAFFLLRICSSYLAQRAIFIPTPEMVTLWQDDTRNVRQIIMRVVPLLSVLVPHLTVSEGACLMCLFPTQRHTRQKEGGWYLSHNAIALYMWLMRAAKSRCVLVLLLSLLLVVISRRWSTCD